MEKKKVVHIYIWRDARLRRHNGPVTINFVVVFSYLSKNKKQKLLPHFCNKLNKSFKRKVAKCTIAVIYYLLLSFRKIKYYPLIIYKIVQECYYNMNIFFTEGFF